MTTPPSLARALSIVIGLSASPAFGAITINNWDADDLSTATGIVDIDVDDLASRTATISNTTTGETTSVTISTANGTLNEVGNPGDNLGVNASGTGDVTSNIDSRDGTEDVNFNFGQTVNVTFLNFSAINFDTDTDFEYVSVRLNGVEIASLFSDNANTSSAGFLGTTNPQAASSDDDFSVNYTVPAGQNLTFVHAQSAGSDQAGFQLDDITFTVVPEPSIALLGGLGLLGLLGLLRRRR